MECRGGVEGLEEMVVEERESALAFRATRRAERNCASPLQSSLGQG